MKETIDVVFENGLLRPLRKLSLSEGRKIRVTLDAAIDDQSAEDKQNSISATDLAELAGSLKNSPLFNEDPLVIQKNLRDEWT
jgi:predicted DNA-binding antitoxin AbrB/MazE fold protein